MKKLFRLSEVEILFSSLVLAWSVVCIPFWPHSLLFLFFFFTYSFVFKLHLLKSLILFLLVFGFYNCWVYLCSWIVKTLNLKTQINSFTYWLQEIITNFIGNRYKGESGKFISYFLFNKKDSSLNSIINDFRMLSLSHLLVVSGMHLNIVDKGVSKLVRKIPYRWARNLICLSSLFSYAWATGFSTPATRVFSEKIILSVKKEQLSESSISNWAQSVWLSFIFFPNSIYSYSFLLSYLYSLSFRVVDKLEITKLQRILVKLGLASFLSFAFFSYATRKIFPLAPFNQLFLTPIVVFVFIYYLVTWPFEILVPLGTKIYSWTRELVANLELNKSFIERPQGSYLEPLYLIFGASLIGLLISKYYLFKRENSLD